MDTRLTLLGLLGPGPGYGHDLRLSWDRWFSQTKSLAFGQIRSSLARLLRDGLIIRVGAEPGAGAAEYSGRDVAALGETGRSRLRLRELTSCISQDFPRTGAPACA